MSEVANRYLKARAERREAVKAAEEVVGRFQRAASRLQNWQSVSFVQTRSPGRNALSGASEDPIVTSEVPSIEELQAAVTKAQGAIGRVRDLWPQVPAEEGTGLKGPNVAD